MGFAADARIRIASLKDDFGENIQDPIICYLAIGPYAKTNSSRNAGNNMIEYVAPINTEPCEALMCAGGVRKFQQGPFNAITSPPVDNTS